MDTIISSQFKYVEVAVEGVNNRNNITTLDSLAEYKYSTDTFRSMFVFDQELVEYVQKHGSVAQYDGNCWIDDIIFDIDEEDNLEKAQYSALRLIEKLAVYDVNPINLGIYFSGNKGFHIAVPSQWFDIKPDPKLPQYIKELAKGIAGDVKIDLSIYNKLRLIRLPLTKHSKTGLYKYPLSYNELINMNVEAIKKQAKFYREDILPARDLELEPLKQLYSKIKQNTQTQTFSIEGSSPVKICYSKMFEGVGKGLRNNVALRLTSYLAKQGIPFDVLYKIMAEWNVKNRPPLTEQELQRVVKSAFKAKYDYGCNDVILKRFCSDDCYLYKRIQEKQKNSSVVSLSSVLNDYEEYVRKRMNSKIKLGIDGIDEALDAISGGDCLYIIARPSIGKTALAVYIVLQLIKLQLKIGFISLEMTKEKIFERIAQAMLGVDKQNLQVLLTYPDMKEEIITKLSDVYINISSSISTADIDYSLSKHPVDVLIIDYMGLVASRIDSAYERVSRIAKELQTIAKKHNVFMIILAQASRKAGDGTRPLTMDMIRDSGVVEEAADYIITMWKPDLFQDIVYLDLVKNRHGMNGIRSEGILDGKTMTWQFQKLERKGVDYE